MSENVRAIDLLVRGRALHDAPGSRMPIYALRESGAVGWTALALGEFRHMPPLAAPENARTLLLVKYAVSTVAMLTVVLLAVAAGAWPLAPLGAFAFYAVEAQMVFLLPLVLDGTAHPFIASRALTRTAGGTIAVMRVVIPIAAVMLLGGFVGRGFLRCWCIGCIAVLLWYERLANIHLTKEESESGTRGGIPCGK